MENYLGSQHYVNNSYVGHPRLHRRKRIESEAAPLPQLGATREDAHPAVQLQLAEAFRLSGADAAQLLLPALSRRDPTSRGDRLSQGARASHRETAADRLGSIVRPPQPLSSGVHRTLRRPHRDNGTVSFFGLVEITSSKRKNLGRCPNRVVSLRLVGISGLTRVANLYGILGKLCAHLTKLTQLRYQTC